MLYRTLDLTFNVSSLKWTGIILQRVSNNAPLHTSVQEINIHWFPSVFSLCGDEGHGCLKLLKRLLPRLSGLKHISYTAEKSFAMNHLSHEECHWDYQSELLPSLINGLNKYHPNCRLSVTLPPRQDLVVALELVFSSKNLYSLTTTFEDPQKLAFDALLRLASIRPNLRKLSITSRGNESNYHHLTSQANFPLNLEVLEVDGIVLSVDEHAESSCIALLEWSRLRKLSLTDPINFHVLVSQTMNLRSLHIGPETSLGSIPVEGIRPWLHSVVNSQRLEEFYVSGCNTVSRCITPAMLEPLRKTLRSLKIHEYEDQTGICLRRVYSVTDVELLGNTMEVLENLGLDLNYDGEWVRNLLAWAMYLRVFLKGTRLTIFRPSRLRFFPQSHTHFHGSFIWNWVLKSIPQTLSDL